MAINADTSSVQRLHVLLEHVYINGIDETLEAYINDPDDYAVCGHTPSWPDPNTVPICLLPAGHAHATHRARGISWTAPA